MLIAAGKFKAQCLKIMDDVHKHHREVIVTKYGKPIVKMVGITNKTKESLFGLLKNSVVIKADIISSVGESWDAQSTDR